MSDKHKILAWSFSGAAIIILFAAIIFLRDQSLVRLQREGVIRIGYAVEAPYAYLKPGGEVSGEDIEVARLIANRLGIRRIEWRVVAFDDLITELEGGRIDVIAAGMFITPERAERVNFSEPTFHVKQGLLVAAGNPHNLHSYTAIVDNPDLRIAVISGAVEQKMLLDLGAKPNQIVEVPDALTGRVAVESGMVDGLALSALSIRWMALQTQLGMAEMAQPFESHDLPGSQFGGYGGFAFRKSDGQLRDAWNSVQAELIGSPEHLHLIAPFGFSANELPGNVTTQEIIDQP